MSEQDFFFDEDEQVAEESAPKSAERPARAQAAKSAPAATAATTAQGISMTVASLIGVVALLAGVVIGMLIPSGDNVPAPTATGTTGTTGQAPQLTQDQLDSGQLPAGHPNISGMTSGTAGSQTTTP